MCFSCLRGRDSVKERLPFKTRPLFGIMFVVLSLSFSLFFVGLYDVDVFSFFSGAGETQTRSGLGFPL